MAQQLDPFYAKFGKRLRTARLMADKSQAVSAGLVGMDQSTLSRLELGQQAITLKNAYDLAALYGVPVEHLVLPTSPLDGN